MEVHSQSRPGEVRQRKDYFQAVKDLGEQSQKGAKSDVRCYDEGQARELQHGRLPGFREQNSDAVIRDDTPMPRFFQSRSQRRMNRQQDIRYAVAIEAILPTGLSV